MRPTRLTDEALQSTTPPGRTRREALALLGLGATGLLPLALPEAGIAQSRLPACVVRPAQTEGPYFVDERLHRTDVRSDPATGVIKPGAPLRLAFQVSKIEGTCTPLANAQVDIWQCDALGVYSDVQDRAGDTRGQKFLRGHQFTDARGIATFQTIYPGWYSGRTTHIHFKIRHTAPGRRPLEFTSQLYFDDALNDVVFATQPYASRGRREARNAQDGLYMRGGRDLMLAVNRNGSGYEGTFDIGLNIA